MPQQPLSPVEMERLSRLFRDIAQDKRYRPIVAEMVRQKFPAEYGSFRDVEQDQKINSIRAELAERDQRYAAREAQTRIDAQRDKMIDSGRYTKEQTDEIKTIIDRHGGMLDYDTAAVLYAHEKTPSEMDGPPTAERKGVTWEFPTVNDRSGKPMDFAAFARDPNTAALNAAYSEISGFMRGRKVR